MITYDLQRFAREQNERITVFPRSRTREAPFQCSCAIFHQSLTMKRPICSSAQEPWEAWILRSSPWIGHGEDLASATASTAKKAKKKTTAALPRVPRWVPYLAPATRHRTSHGRTSTQPRRRHGSPIDRRRPTRQHHLRPGVQYES